MDTKEIKINDDSGNENDPSDSSTTKESSLEYYARTNKVYLNELNEMLKFLERLTKENEDYKSQVEEYEEKNRELIEKIQELELCKKASDERISKFEARVGEMSAKLNGLGEAFEEIEISVISFTPNVRKRTIQSLDDSLWELYLCFRPVVNNNPGSAVNWINKLIGSVDPYTPQVDVPSVGLNISDCFSQGEQKAIISFQNNESSINFVSSLTALKCLGPKLSEAMKVVIINPKYSCLVPYFARLCGSVVRFAYQEEADIYNEKMKSIDKRIADKIQHVSYFDNDELLNRFQGLDKEGLSFIVSFAELGHLYISEMLRTCPPNAQCLIIVSERPTFISQLNFGENGQSTLVVKDYIV